MNTKPLYPLTDEGISLAGDYIISRIEIKKNKYIYEEKNQNTTAVFLAGAPGSGKTEFIQSALSYMNDFFFIDIDSYRELFEWYCGSNAWKYQEAMSRVVDKVLKYCLQNNIRFILDGTFKSKKHSLRNIETCNAHGRMVDIYFLFQPPLISYYYTYLREIQQTRNIPVDGFVECFYNSIRNIFLAKNGHSNVNLYICEKTIGNGVLGNKKYTIYDTKQIKDIQTFCKKFNVAYTLDSDTFHNQDNIRKSIEDFRFLLNTIRPFLRLYYLIINKLLWLKKN